MRIFWLAPVMALLVCAQLPAQDNTELLNRMKTMEDRIKALEAEVQGLKGQQTAAVTTPAPTPLPAVQAAAVAPQAPEPAVQSPVLGGAGPAAAKVLNPDISAIGDFIGA